MTFLTTLVLDNFVEEKNKATFIRLNQRSRIVARHVKMVASNLQGNHIYFMEKSQVSKTTI